MPRSTLEALALRWVPGAGPIDIRPLANGLVNDSYRVSRGGCEYSLRVAAGDADELGLDRSWECRVLKEAARAGLAPPVFECEPSVGVVVTGWMEGRAWTRDEGLEPVAMGAMAHLMRRVHALPIPSAARAMSPADWIAHYAQARARRGVAGSEAATRLGGASRVGGASWVAAAEEHLARLGSLGPVAPVICHSDLHCQNLLSCMPASAGGAAGTVDALVLLDWEYSHVADPFWDLAGWASNNDWSHERAEALLSLYLQRTPTSGESHRLRALAWLYDYVCLLWSELYVNLRVGVANAAVLQRAHQLRDRLLQLR